MTGLTIFVGGGFGPIGDRYPGMSPSLRASLAAADAEYVGEAERVERQRREAWAEAHKRCVDQEMFRIAREEGLPLAAARRRVGHEPREFVELCSARCDLEDARRAASEAAQMRRLAVDAGLLDMPEPPPVLAEIAARTMRSDESPDDVGRGSAGGGFTSITQGTCGDRARTVRR